MNRLGKAQWGGPQTRISYRLLSSNSDGGPSSASTTRGVARRPRPGKEMKISSQANLANFLSWFFKGRAWDSIERAWRGKPEHRSNFNSDTGRVLPPQRGMTHDMER
mmetsp:Transcript_16255/g.37603  ORF Transcript_16255/g.37603 Transcript_16255/m.37603 type:complete len:107 (+) Transcript_16255:454-774(+)